MKRENEVWIGCPLMVLTIGLFISGVILIGGKYVKH